MEFHEKLQELRKSRGLTQEELAEALYVSRAAVSKWESARGYPGIDSLKEISKYFSVTIDDLLSGEKLLSIAEKENKANIRNMCEFLFAITDLCVLLLIVLPLYPDMTEGKGAVYSVNLFSYTEAAPVYRFVYWGLFVSLILLGLIKMILIKGKIEKGYRIITDISLGLHSLSVLVLGMTRVAYAIVAAFFLLLIKGMLLLKWVQTGR